jgi:hypothetical protein
VKPEGRKMNRPRAGWAYYKQQFPIKGRWWEIPKLVGLYVVGSGFGLVAIMHLDRDWMAWVGLMFLASPVLLVIDMVRWRRARAAR